MTKKEIKDVIKDLEKEIKKIDSCLSDYIKNCFGDTCYRFTKKDLKMLGNDLTRFEEKYVKNNLNLKLSINDVIPFNNYFKVLERIGSGLLDFINYNLFKKILLKDGMKEEVKEYFNKGFADLENVSMLDIVRESYFNLLENEMTVMLVFKYYYAFYLLKLILKQEKQNKGD